MLMFCLLFPAKESIAPAFIRFSSVLLLASLELSLEIIFSSEVYFPLAFLSATITSAAATPIPLTAESPKRMLSPDTEKLLSPSFTSGGSIPIFI